MLPLFMPGVVLGLGVAMAFGGCLDLRLRHLRLRGLVMLAHSLWAMPLVFMLMEATFRTVDHRIVEASYDLGGRPVQTFFEIVLPIGFHRHHLVGAVCLRHLAQRIRHGAVPDRRAIPRPCPC
jgi:ABC-type spermidine/putrescine transport system permease subunit II